MKTSKRLMALVVTCLTVTVLVKVELAARGESPTAFGRRCIPSGCVAPRSNIPDILTRRALPAGRIVGLGATPDSRHGLLGGQGRGSAEQTAAARSQKEELSETYRGSQRNNVEYQKVAPIKLFDDLYYVGPGFVSVWLIPTTQGLILIDSAQEPYVDHVLDSIRKVGFDPKDIKYLVISHGHLDHFGGAARIQELSGARVGMLEEDWRLIDEAAKAPANPNRPAARLPKRDLVFKEGDTLTSGNTTLKFSKMPGHTPGSLSAEFTVHDGGNPYKAFMFGGPGPRGGVEGAEQFLASANRLAKIEGVQVAVQVHSWLNDYHYPNGSIFERAQKLARRRAGDPNPFVDPGSWSLWVKQVQDGALKNLEEEKQKAAK